MLSVAITLIYAKYGGVHPQVIGVSDCYPETFGWVTHEAGNIPIGRNVILSEDLDKQSIYCLELIKRETITQAHFKRCQPIVFVLRIKSRSGLRYLRVSLLELKGLKHVVWDLNGNFELLYPIQLVLSLHEPLYFVLNGLTCLPAFVSYFLFNGVKTLIVRMIDRNSQIKILSV